MQCENTPRRQAHEDLTTQLSTAVQLYTAHKRSSIRKSLQDDPDIRAIIKHIDATPFNRHPQYHTTLYESPPASSPACKASQVDPSKEGLTKDIFLDEEHEANPQARRATVQFHEAARRLALAPVVDSNENEASKDRTDQPLEESTDATATPCNYSRRFRAAPALTGRKQNEYSTERDITSARRSYTSKTDITTPVRRLVQSGRHTTVSVHGQLADKPSPSQHSIARVRNFSRPASHTPLGKQRKQNLISKHHVESASHSASSRLETAKTEDETKPMPQIPINARNALPTTRDNAGPVHIASINKEKLATHSASSRREEASPPKNHSATGQSDYIRTEDLTDKRRQLKRWQVWLQRIVIILFVLTANLVLGIAWFTSRKHPYLLAVLVFMKSKDILSTAADLFGILHDHFHRLIWPPEKPELRWIMSLVCAYAETEEQIMKTVMSLVKSDTRPHRQVICIILDGKPRDVLSKMSTVKVEFERPYVTWRGACGQLNIFAGTIENTPTILIQKVKNAGKKDSLILGHDLFNHPRKDMPHSTKLLREEIWELTMPHLVSMKRLRSFDFIFCTDADSTIHEKCLQRLANALCQTKSAVAACGILFAELDTGWTEYSPWHLFQQFQYTFGQYVRRQAESTFGRVTCLPGCVTMIVVRPELGSAMSEYARPVTGHNLLRHQVQYLGTDRRLTWCMLSRDKHLRTVFVPDALSETVTPSSLSHYLSQRRRWASNAYFNDWFYLLGPQQRLATRLFAAIDIVRLTLVFYRVFNTGYFIHGLATNFYVVKVIPTLIVTKTPATWYLILILLKERVLRRRLHKLLMGMCINQVISPILSVIVMVNVLLHVGSQAWGKTGASTQGKPAATINHNEEVKGPWTPKRLAKSVRQAIRGATPRAFVREQSRAPTELPITGTNSRKQEGKKHIIFQQAQTPISKVSHTDKEKGNSEPTGSTSSLDSVSKVKPEETTIEQTPARRTFQDGYPTPSTLLRRTPFRRGQRAQDLTQTPTKKYIADTEVDLDAEP